MPDSFFASTKIRKRKRPVNTTERGGSAKKIIRKGKASSQDATHAGTRRRVTRAADEELNSDRTDSEGGGIDDIDLRASIEPETSGDEDAHETPAEKRLRLAKLYLDSVKDGLGKYTEGEFDAAEIDRELISERLRQDVLEHSGKVHLFVADSYDFTSTTSLRCKGHRFSVTSAVASEDAQYLYTSGKEGTIIKWSLQSGEKIATFYKKHAAKGKEKALPQDIQGHTDEILSLAVSSDGRYLASGSKDRRVGVWDVEKDEWVKGFGGHKDSVASVAFRKGTQQLYTGSFDRTIKLFDLSAMGYVETLFGHQDTIVSLDALRGETAVTAGARDRTVRFWKIADESQLVFRGGGKSAIRELLEGGAFEGHEDDENMDEAQVDDPKSSKGKDKIKEKRYAEGSIECVAMIDETTFISGGDSGSICLWTTQKKKPIYTQTLCHGFHEVQSATEGLLRTPRWITAVASLRYSDTFASGSWDGDVRLWKLDQKLRSFSLVGSIPACGVVNSLQLLGLPKGALDNASWREKEQRAPTKSLVRPALLVVGLGQELRLGRWLSLKGEGIMNATTVHIIYPRT
ncbi:WD40 repeat-like protein [Rhizopogon vinicolor AM-OR11-026]|uniref:WD40 repeat-like protein n=1 Tax=Rhizopogon vinicolor AM-OR11-026 TaxID=1314800 RepID=A0A1B7NG26_9AGAM|nr:WD40 repeat-like protein [Rhizopogon vinicolor AM-OR11-026]